MAITTIQLKRGRASSWATLDPVLAAGEPGFEIDTGRLKIGNGIDSWNELKYVGEDGQGVINATTHYDFPSIGDENFIYKASEEEKIYQWNPELKIYEELNSTKLTEDDGTTLVLYGGSATDNI